ncbi:AT-hook motif nuclear-localized protein 1 [Camellia lanceoleosa]|uniref:AT-hook motif nuclear-localized protein 1 n=1 Tax=Camellia lanceoleosa TaxID=1840588 RepID=A0ACC0HK20_9ERIC|nr:AT-hook motif nuclear-localized protein 1 [Camellia lanceoleosa]
MEEKEILASGSPAVNSVTQSPPVHGGGGGGGLLPQGVNMAAVNMSMGRSVGVTTGGDGGGAVACGGGDLVGKKKRGRPRKYDSDGNLRLSYVSPPPAQAPPPPGFCLSLPAAASSEFSSKRGRGRPSGSGNWQLLASLGELFTNTAGGDFTPHVVTVNSGEDVAAKILSFSQKGPRGICILSANGAISNVTIRQPGSSGGLLTYEGRFEILSLTGSFTVSENGGVRSRTGGLSVSLAGPDGRVIGGGIAGLLMAASPIQIVVGSFMPNGYKVHKRKHNYEPRITSITPSVLDTVTAATPISQAAPAGDTWLTPTSQLPLQQSHEEADKSTSNKQNMNATSMDSAEWNGSEPTSDQRPYPDINVSVLIE